MISTLASPAGMAVFAYTMVYAGLSDLTTMKIKNGLVLVLLVAFAVLAPLVGFSILEIAVSAVVAMTVLLFGFLCFARGWIGGGDAKLAAVTALWLGFAYTPAYLIYMTLFGGILALALWQFRNFMPVLPAFLHNQPWIVRLHAGDLGVPYGVAMAASALVVFPQTRWMVAFF